MSNNAAFVGSIPENYDRYLGPVVFEPYAADLVARLALPEEASVLELACGTGILTRRLRSHLPHTAKLTATDLNEAMMDLAASKFRTDENIEWKQADARELPFPDQTFDAVICQFGLMFFPDKARAAREVYRVMKPGGTFLFSVWDAIELNDLAQIAHATIASFFPDDPPNFYQVPFSFHDREAIQSLLTEAGFRNSQLSVVPMSSTGPSARGAARGLIHGNPVLMAIKDRDESKLPAIEAAIATKIATELGDQPVRARMQAIVCSALR